jgi:4-diphosphocytidyl-2-C-methyl-D-erythritol kinase
VFYPLPFTDALEIIPSTTTSLNISGLSIPGEPSENLCIKAWHLLKQDFPWLPFVNIYLQKHIPAGAGLGGGSADGAFMLQALNKKFELGIAIDQLQYYARQLGSDCPFFILNKPCYATGRGEILEPLTTNPLDASFVLVHPGIHINTALAFSRLKPAKPLQSIREIISLPVEQWKDVLENDFEKVVLNDHPLLAGIKQKLYASGALYASMTGSGSAFYGIFEKNKLPSISFEQNFKLTYIK